MNIVISGLTSSGKTYYARRLADRLGFDYVCAGQMLLDLIGLPPEVAPDPWFTHFNEIAAIRDATDVDRELDRTLVDLARTKTNLVIDSWILPWLYPGPMVKVWISCSDIVRARKTQSSRPAHLAHSLTDCRDVINRKDDDARRRFATLYGIELGPSREIFDLMLDNTSYYDESDNFESSCLARQFLDRLCSEASEKFDAVGVRSRE